MSTTPRPGGRYQVKESLGHGGMGDVYLALDTNSEPPREVALKTIRDGSDPAAVELFKRECSVLMSFNHPNVIELYDSGDFDDRGVIKPFFVMARLRGVTLAQLIKESPQHLTVERTVEILYQVCRGLQAAHDHNLVHRDIKPSNIFVLEDDSVKVIDFGVAHLVSSETLGAKGTLYYMAPEQIEHKLVTIAADIFSLGVVCFEALTRKKPFAGNTPDEIRAAVTKRIPPPASSLNPAVNNALSQVIHAAMAKKPLHRFASAREFGECLKKAMRNEPIERFEPGKLQIRITRVERALEASQYEIASDILAQLEEEGYLHPSLGELRRQVDQAIRNRDIRQFLETTRRFLAQDEYILALQKVHDAMQLDPTNAEAIALRTEIESKRNAQQIGNWLRLAQEHLGNYAFEPAREAVESVLRMAPTDAAALRLKGEINRVEQEIIRKRGEKERYYESAIEFHNKGDLTAALSRLERVLQLDREAPDGLRPERAAEYQKFYNEVRSEAENIRNSLDEAKSKLESREYAAAEAICDTFLEKYPNHALFQALKYDIGDRQRQNLSAYIAEIDRKAEAEPDLERKAKLLEEALNRCPGEVHFERALKGVTAKRDLINGLENQARNLDTRGLYSEAIDKWEMLRAVYKQFPGLDIEIDHLRKRLEQHARSEAKARWIERIDSTLNSAECSRALELVQQALLEFPADAQLIPLERLARQRVEQSVRAQDLLDRGQKLLEAQSHDDALAVLEEAHTLDAQNDLIRAVYIESLVRKASAIIDTDVEAADRLIHTAYGLDATNPRVKSMRVLTTHRKRALTIDGYLSKAREFQAANDLVLASKEVEKGLAAYPEDAQLRQLQVVLTTMVDASQKKSELRRDREKMAELQRSLELSKDSVLSRSLLAESKCVAGKHPDDEQIQVIATEIGTQVRLPKVDANESVPDSKLGLVQEHVEEFPEVVLPTPRRDWRSELAALNLRIAPYRWHAAVALVLMIASVSAVLLLLNKSPEPPTSTDSPGAARIEVPLTISPEVARVRVGQQDFGDARKIPLETGVHEISISAPGYRTEVLSVTVNPSGTNVKPVTLSPLPTIVEINKGSATIRINDQVVQDDALRQELTSGDQERVVAISDALGRRGQFSFIATTAAMPTIEQKPNWQNTFGAALVVSFGDRARVYGPQKVKFDGGAEQDVPVDGLEFPPLGEARHEIAFGANQTYNSMIIQAQASPTLTLMIPAADQGQIKITSNQKDIEVWVRRGTEREVRRTLQFSLTPGDYWIRGEKAGYSQSGPHKVSVRAGSVETVNMNFVSKYASLLLTELPSNAEVFVRSIKLAGEVKEGSFRSDAIDPGSGEISVRVENIATVPLTVTFSAGDAVRRSWRDFVRPTWQVTVSCPVADCEISLSQGQAAPEKIAAGTLSLSQGNYVFTGTALNHNTDRKPLTLPSTEPKVIELKPTKIELPPAPAPPPPPLPPPAAPKKFTINDLKPPCFVDKDKKDFFMCTGSRVPAGYGTHTFEVEVKGDNPITRRGGRDGKWAAGSKDKWIEFTLKTTKLEAVSKPTASKLAGNEFDKASTTYKVEIIVSPTMIEQRITANPSSGPRTYRQQWAISGGTPQEFWFRDDNLIRSYSFNESK